MTNDGARPPWPHVPLPLGLLLFEGISDSAKVLWALLYQVSVTGGGASFEMSVEQMVSLSHGSKPSIIKRKKELVDAGWLDETALRGLGRTNLYTVRIPNSEVPAEQPGQ